MRQRKSLRNSTILTIILKLLTQLLWLLSHTHIYTLWNCLAFNLTRSIINDSYSSISLPSSHDRIYEYELYRPDAQVGPIIFPLHTRDVIFIRTYQGTHSLWLFLLVLNDPVFIRYNMNCFQTFKYYSMN